MRDGMMDCEDVVALIDEIRRLGSELDDVETKAAQGGLPARIYRSLSALSNRRGGGVILLGVDEETLACSTSSPVILSATGSDWRWPICGSTCR